MRADDNKLILVAIEQAAVAGGLRFWARKDARAAAGLNKAAGRYSEKSRAALTAWTKKLGVAAPGSSVVKKR